MKKLIFFFLCASILCSCNNTKKVDSKKFAGKYTIEFPTDGSGDQEVLALASLFLQDISIVFYENGDGILDNKILKAFASEKQWDGTFHYSIEQDTLLNISSDAMNAITGGTVILRKVGNEYDYIKLINPKTNKIVGTLVRKNK